MFKNFLMQKMMERQLKNVPKDQQEMIMNLVQKHPEVFQKLALEVQQKMKAGKSQTAAAMEVMQAHKDELKGLLG